jgi:hypothetical protein
MKMKKNEEELRNLTWKLSERPTAQVVAELVNAGVITSEEGREIVFGSPESDKDKIATLEQQVEVLTELVKNLSKSTTTLVPYDRIVTVPYRQWNDKIWMNTAQSLKGTGYTITGSTNAAGTGTATYSIYNDGTSTITS